METLREIRRRIASITKISQVTDAMRMVATAKLRRAQQAIEANRPYANKFNRILTQLVSDSCGAPAISSGFHCSAIAHCCQ